MDENRIDAPVVVAEIQHSYAKMLDARGGPGGRDRAAELVGAALETAERLGMAALAERARLFATA